MVESEKLRFNVVTYSINKVYFKKWFSSYEIPYYARFFEIIFMAEDIVNSLFGYLEGHPLFRVLPNEIAIFAGKLAVLSDNKCYVFCRSGLPRLIKFPI